ncbi:MAG: hypothetical protein M3R66_07760 [Actinomycetota bacterium]|nr:hypothetical protein [Actinomycetota bacterium]
MTTAYDVTISRDDNLWVAAVHDLPPHLLAVTDVEHFADLDVEVRDLIAGLIDTDPGDFAINWRYEVDGHDVTDRFHRFLAVESELREQWRRVQELQEARDAERLALLRDLAQTGLSQRAIGDAIALSHQRVHQLLKSSRADEQICDGPVDPRRTGSGWSRQSQSSGAGRSIPRRGARRGEAVAVNRGNHL